ncbi:MAG TPA: neutral zinc metallopeptidase [Burkholderiales bacterium]|nr:neutral zinc metallopeptidase [Burkholderiales bacterium]
MRWEGDRQSENVEDRRGMSVSGRGLALGGIGTIIVTLIALYLGVDPSALLDQIATTAPPGVQQQGGPSSRSPEENKLAEFSSVVLADTEDVWGQVFKQNGATYANPKLVLYTGAVESACGFAQAAMGPFYCPNDRKLYLDLSFFNDLHTRYGASGDFAQAYVIAHEVGHHVQNQLGILEKARVAQEGASKQTANAIQVRVELQADCLAGVWANKADQMKHVLESGDIEEALAAAAGVGDDRLQRKARGYVVPESFTHGTSAERQHWFSVGAKSGDMGRCNTFSAAR